MFSLMNIGFTLLVILGFIIICLGCNCLFDNALFDYPRTLWERLELICAWITVVISIGLIILLLLAVVYGCITKPIQCNSINNDSEECLIGDGSNE